MTDHYEEYDQFEAWEEEQAWLASEGAKAQADAEARDHYEEMLEAGVEPGKPELKTSEEWQEICRVKVLDPDAGYRLNYEYSWHGELITRDEFERRLSICKNCLQANSQMYEALKELVEIVDDYVQYGSHTMDSFTTQPAKQALAETERRR